MLHFQVDTLQTYTVKIVLLNNTYVYTHYKNKRIKISKNVQRTHICLNTDKRAHLHT